MATGRILIVDDEQSLLDLLAIAFDGTDCATETCLTAEDAIYKIASSGPYNLLLVDKNLPGMSGIELIRIVRHTDPDVSIVLMTAYATAESVRETMSLEIEAYIEKPFADILAVVELITGTVKRKQTPAPALAPIPVLPSGDAPNDMVILIAALDAETREKIIGPIDGSQATIEFAGSRGEVLAAIEHRRPNLIIIDGACYPPDVQQIAESILILAPEATSVVLSSEEMPIPVLRRLVDLRVCGVFDKNFDDVYKKGINALIQRVRLLPRPPRRG